MDLSKKEKCYFNFTYNLDGDGLNNGDFEYEPFLVTWGTYQSSTGEYYDITKVDQMQFTKSYIKEALKKGEKTKAGKKVKQLYKKGKKGYKKGKKQIQEEKQGIKEYRDEKKKLKEGKRAKAKAEKDAKTKKKPLPTPKKKEKTSLFYIGKDYDSKSGSEESTKSDDDETSEEDSEDQSSEESSEEEEETTTKSSFLNALGDEQEESFSKEIKCYKESKPVGDYELPDSNKMRGDEDLWLKLMVHTSHSGQESIDKKELPFVKRTQQAGYSKIQISQLVDEIYNFQNGKPLRENVKIQSINASEILLNYETSFYMPKAYNIKKNELKEQNPNLSDKEISDFVLKLCTKSSINIQFHFFNVSKQLIQTSITSFNKISNFYKKIDAIKFMTLMNQQPPLYLTDGGTEKQKEEIFIPFNHQLHAEILEKSMGYFIRNYKKSMYSSPDSVPLYKPFNSQVENLHLAYYTTEQGDLPVINYMIRKKKTEFTDDSEKYFLIQLSASLKRNGLGIDNFISIVNEQFERKDDKIIHNFMNCVDAVNNIGTFAATQILYTSDFRYLNDRYGKKGTQVNMDSWDTDVSAGYGSSDDCEGSGSICVEILSYIKKGKLLDQKTKTYGWHSPALETARKILCNRITSGIASTVTEAFVDNQGQKISNKKVTNLPIVGDQIDLNSPVGGHFFGISTPNAIIAKQLKNSPDFKNYNSTIKEFVNKTYYPWEYNQSILILEGTAMIKSDILPPEESFKNDKVELQKNEALRKMFKFIRENSKPEDGDVDTKKDYKLTLFNSIMSPEGLPFYFDKQDPNRRISKFYKDAVHFISTELYDMDETFSHLIYCNKKSNTFGCNIGDILRKDSNIMLARPLVSSNSQFERTLWKNSIMPLMSTVVNQQPSSIIANYTPEQTSHLISQKIFNDVPDLKIENSDIKNHMFLKGTEKVINITNNQSLSYIINGKENPVLLLNQGTHYKLKINSKGHPFFILQKQGNEYVPFKGIIKNNGTDNGNIKIFIPCEQDVSNLIYVCSNHDQMTGTIGIKKTLECSEKGDMPDIDYKYKKPKWHFDSDISTVCEKDNMVVMNFFTRRFNFDSNPKVLPQIKQQLEFLKENGLVDYAFFEEKYFPQCEAVISLLMVLDVNKVK